MILKCAACGQNIEFADGLPDGQHVRCPYCGTKMELNHSLDGIPSFRVLSGDVGAKQTPVRLHVRQPARVSVPSRTPVQSPRVPSPQMVKKRGGSGDWVIYALLAVVVCGGIVAWMHKRGKEHTLPPAVAQIGLSEDSDLRSDVNADIERRRREEVAERERHKIREEREEEEKAKRRAEKAKRDAEREKERQEMAERAERERQLREIVSKAEMGFNGSDSVFAMDFSVGKRPFDFTEDGEIFVADENYAGDRSIYRLTVDDKRLKSVQKFSQQNGAVDIPPDEFMSGIANKVVLAKMESGPVWICGKTKMNELIEVPESADTYVPLSDFMGGALSVLDALKAMPPAIKYRVTLKAKNGKSEIKLGVVESEVDVQAIRSKIRERLTDRKMKSTGLGVKPPKMKKFKRTVVFYEGEIIKTEMGGLTKVPRHYVYHGSWQNRTTAEERWKALAKKAEEQDREELEVEAENQRRMDEYRRKADSALRDSKVTEDEVDAELGLYRLFIERSRTKLPKG